MARKRFNADEKRLIASGLPIEWQNVTQWHAGEITSTEIVKSDEGWQHVIGKTLATTRTMSYGETIWITPGHIRQRRTVAEMRQHAAEFLAAELGDDVREWMV